MTTTDLLIRDASIEEAEVVLQIWRLAFGEERIGATLSDVQRVIFDDHTSRILLASQEGKAVGALVVTFDIWRGHLYRLAVLPEHQRQGIARALVSNAADWLKAVGCKRVTVNVETGNEFAAFWPAIGFEAEAEVTSFEMAIG